MYAGTFTKKIVVKSMKCRAAVRVTGHGAIAQALPVRREETNSCSGYYFELF